jgi:hypothetical protein
VQTTSSNQERLLNDGFAKKPDDCGKRSWGSKTVQLRKIDLVELSSSERVLQLGDVRRLGALGTLGHLEGDALVFLERPEPAILDGGVMDEEIGTSFIGRDESVSLFGVEPLDGALSHGTT